MDLCLHFIFNTGVTSFCRSLFGCFLICVEIHVPPRIVGPVSQPNPFYTCSPDLQSISISIISLLGITRAGQLQNELWSAAPGAMGSLHPPSPVPDCCYQSKDSQQEQRCLKTHVIWRIVSHICTVCVAPQQCTAFSKCVGEDAGLVFTSPSISLRAWNLKCAHVGTQASHSMEKATPGADRGLKVSGFEKHRSKSRCFHSNRQELIVGSALAYRLSFLWSCPQSLWLFSVVSDRTHKEVFH